MTKRCLEDASTIGSILLSMGSITEEELWQALIEQKKLREDQLLGKLLVAAGAVTPAQLEQAMAAQRAMRSKQPREAALASADLAIARHRRTSIVARRERIYQKSQGIVKETKRITETEHPVVPKEGFH